MPERQEIRPVKLECTGEGHHRFERELWCWVHYIDSQDEPVFWRTIDTTGVECPECGYSAEEVTEGLTGRPAPPAPVLCTHLPVLSRLVYIRSRERA